MILVQNEGYDIKLGDVNFAGDTTTTGARRTLLVTSLDNDEVVAGDAVSLGDTNVTTTDADGIFASATLGAVTTIGGKPGDTTPVAFASGPGSVTDLDAIVTTQALDSYGNNALSLVDATQTLNSFVTIQGDADTSGITFLITGTDVYGNAQTETIAGPSAAGASNHATSTKIFGTVTEFK